MGYHWFDDYPTHLSLLTDGRVLVSGGFLSDIGPLSSSELYDPAIGTWTTTGPMKKARGWHTMTLLQNGQVLVAGGSGPPNDGTTHPLASAELYGSPNVTAILLINAAMLPGGVFQFACTNTPATSFSVFGTTNLSAPFTNWTALGNATEISSGSYQFTDTQTTNCPQRFYRVRQP